jgi:hypothetical protein
VAGLALVGSLTLLGACGGRTDGGNPGNPAGDTTTTGPTVPGG